MKQSGAEYNNAKTKKLSDGGSVRFISVETLIRMKEQAGRAQDLADIEQLKLGLDDGSK